MSAVQFRPWTPCTARLVTLKIYKQLPNGQLAYREAWATDAIIIEHWGVIGDRGQTAEHELDPDTDENENLEAVLAGARADGFSEIDEDEHATLLVEYEIDGWGTEDDQRMRHQLEQRLNETLGWTGLGHCDGGSIGSGTMEVCCYVVDFDVARRVIERDLSGTPFALYSRIYRENEPEDA